MGFMVGARFVVDIGFMLNARFVVVDARFLDIVLVVLDIVFVVDSRLEKEHACGSEHFTLGRP